MRRGNSRSAGCRRAKRRALRAFACMVFLMGSAVLLWPKLVGAHLASRAHAAVSEFYDVVRTVSQAHQDDVKIEYINVPAPTPSPRPYADLYNAMLDYNRRIYDSGQAGLCDAWSYQVASFDLQAYGIEDEAIGVISIPKMDVELPIYLGASSENMAKGAVHLSQTSLPIGGTDTNCVIAAHRGWYGAPYFRYIDVLEEGDEVYVTNLWETLTYKVSEIRVINPDDVGQILIQPGRDLLTLLTCHPFASGGLYRYVVYCERKEGP